MITGRDMAAVDADDVGASAEASGVMRVAVVVRDELPDVNALVEAAQRGDLKARDKVVAVMMPLVELLARRFDRPELQQDLVQAGIAGGEGHIVRGLLRAIQLFTPAAGVKFSTYAGHWIRSAMRRELARLHDSTGQSHRVRERTATVRRMARKLSVEQGGAEPTAVEVLIAVRGEKRERLTLPAVERALLPLPRAVGVEALENTTIGSEAAMASRVDAIRQLRLIEAEIDKLPERQARIVKRFYGLGQNPETADEIAEAEKLSRSQVWRLLQDGINIVRAGVSADE